MICLVFSGTNLYGFMKCSKEQQGKLTKLGANAVVNLAGKGVGAAKNSGIV